MSQQPSRRNKVFISNRVQGRLLMRAVAYWLVYHLVLWHTLFIFEYFHYRVELIGGGTPMSLSELYGQFTSKYYPIIVSALGVLPILAIDMLKYTHRIAGPLVNFANVLKRLRNGETVNHVTLRQGDLLLELQEEFNAFLKFYNEQHGTADLSAIDSDETTDEESPEEQILQDINALQKSMKHEAFVMQESDDEK